MERTEAVELPLDPQGTLAGSNQATAEPRPALHTSSSNKNHDAGGLLLGRLMGFNAGQPIVAFQIAGTQYQSTACATVGSIHADDIGSPVCLALSDGDLSRPILLGKIRNAESMASCADKLEITHPHEIALRCGKSTVQLKSDGTIAIRGTNVASRAAQTNRIRGGNVQIN